LSVDCDGFEVETVMNIRAAKAKLKVHEVPSYEHSRVHGVSNLHIGRDGWRIVKVIVRERLSGRARSQGPAASDSALVARLMAEKTVN
jgi:hypothetical protein